MWNRYRDLCSLKSKRIVCFRALLPKESRKWSTTCSETDTQKTCVFGKYSRGGLRLAKTFRCPQDRKERLCTKSASIRRKHLLKCHFPQLRWSNIWAVFPIWTLCPCSRGFAPCGTVPGLLWPHRSFRKNCPLDITWEGLRLIRLSLGHVCISENISLNTVTSGKPHIMFSFWRLTKFKGHHLNGFFFSSL